MKMPSDSTTMELSIFYDPNRPPHHFFEKGDTIKKQGIYVFTSPSGKQYVGQSCDIVRRLKQHFQKKHPQCPALSNAIEKYGKEAFDVEIIEYTRASVDALNSIEQWQITYRNTLSPNGYNLRGGGKKSVLSDESKKKIGDRHRGKTLSDETKKKIRDANSKRWQDPEYRKKRSEAATKRKETIRKMIYNIAFIMSQKKYVSRKKNSKAQLKRYARERERKKGRYAIRTPKARKDRNSYTLDFRLIAGLVTVMSYLLAACLFSQLSNQ